MNWLKDTLNEWTGEKIAELKQWTITGAANTWELFIESADALVLVAMALVLLRMFGAKWPGQYIYWVVVAYIVVKFMGVMA